MKQRDIDRFWNKVDKTSDPNGCWVWTASKDNRHYGLFYYNNKLRKAHRVSAQYFGNLNINNLFVCHHCDNPSCVNPNHLYAGTSQDNINDMYNRQRAATLQPIKTPLGIFNSIQEAAKAHNVHPVSIQRYTKKYPKDYYRL